MEEIDIASRKKILANPVALFTETYPDAPEETVSSLTKFHRQYCDLQTQHKEKKDHCKKISRQFGEAKKRHLSTDNLMHTMREQSSALKEIEGEIKKTSDEILRFFNFSYSNESVNSSEGNPETRTHNNETVIDENISVSLLNHESKEWNNYIESNNSASIYHRAEWKNLIKNVFGHSSLYFVARNKNGNVVGVLPLIRLKSKLFGDFMTSMPYFNYGGAIANNISIEQKLIEAANEYAKKIGVSHAEYRDDIPREKLPVRSEKVNMILKLPDNKSDLWNSFSSKLRSQIKRPQREKTRVLIGKKECLDDFYNVFARNMRDLGTPVYGKSFFSNILQCFPEHSNIVVVYIENRPVSAAFIIGYKGTLEIPWASTIKDANHLSMNMLLYWEVLKFAIENKYHSFDFGRSSKDSGTYRFKQQWGAKAKQLYWHYWLPENTALPKLNPDNPKYSMAISIWKKLPVFITRLIGPLIIKNLP